MPGTEGLTRSNPLAAALMGVFDEVYQLDVNRLEIVLLSSRLPRAEWSDEPRPLEEKIELWFARHVFAEDAPALRAFLEPTRSGRQGSWSTEYRLRRQDGVALWVTATLLYLRPGVYLLCNRDETGRKEAERAQLEHELLFVQRAEDELNRLLIERTGLCIFDYDAQSDVLHMSVNTPEQGITHYDRLRFFETILTNPLIHPDHRQPLHELLLSARHTPPGTGTFEYISDTWQTGWRWTRMQYTGITDEQGRLLRIVGQIADVQDEKDNASLLADLTDRLAEPAHPVTEGTSIAERIFELLYEVEDVEAAISSILETLGRHFDVSRVYIFEDSPDHLTCSNTFEWCNEGAEPQIDALQNISYEHDLGGLFQQNFDEHGVFLCRDIAELPRPQYDILAPQGIYSMLQCAILDDGVFSGYIGFDECRHPDRVWTDEQVRVLSLVSRRIGFFLMKKRRGDQAALSDDFMAALDNNSSFIYIIEPDTHRIVFCNKAILERFGRNYEGEVCYREFICLDQPCEHCPVGDLLANKPPRSVEIRRPDGLWMLSQASPLRWHGRSLIMITCHDVTEQKLAAEELLIQSEENAIVAAQSGKLISRYDLSTRRLTRYFDIEDLFGVSNAVITTPEESLDCGFIAPEDAELYRAFFANIDAGRRSGSVDLRLRVKNEYRWYHGDYTLIHDPDGRPARAIISFSDNSVQIEKELAYRRWQNSLSALLSESSAYIELNLSTGIVEKLEGPPHFLDRPGVTLDEFIAHGLEHFVAPDDCEAFAVFLDRRRLLSLYARGVYEDALEYRLRPSDEGGEAVWMRAAIQMVRSPYSREITATVIFTDSTVDRRELERLSALATRDSLTALFNHDATEQRISEILLHSGPDDRFALFMLDLDDFKQINDTLGHQSGDEVLARAARSIAQVFRAGDVVGRIGGDEFMAFMGGGAEEEVVCQRAEALVKSLQFRFGELTLSASVGAVIASGGGPRFSELYTLADKALYAAKRAGKNRYHIVDASNGHIIETERDDFPIQLNALLEHMEGGVVLLSIGEHIAVRYVSPSLPRILADPDLCDADADALKALVHPDDRAGLSADLRAVLPHAQPLSRTFRLAPPLESCWHLRAAPLPAGPGSERLLICVLTDVTQLKRSEDQVRFAEERYRDAVELTGSMLWEADLASHTLYQFPPELADPLVEPSAYPGAPDSLFAAGLVHAGSEGEVRRLFDDLYAENEGRSYTFRCRLHTDMEFQWVKAGFRLLRRADGTPYYAVGVLTPVPETAGPDVQHLRALEQLVHLQGDELARSHRDEVTGLLGKRAFFRRVRDELARQPELPRLLIRCDLDRFKIYNDLAGAKAGDALLRGLGERLHALGGPDALCARLETDHFCLLLPAANYSEEGLKNGLAEWIREEAHDFRLSLSIGVYAVDEPGLDVSLMCDRALLALRTVKQRYEPVKLAWFGRQLRQRLLDEQALTARMSEALAAGEFVLHFQPQIDYSTGALIGAEALVRWQHPTRGLLGAPAFIPLFEQNGFITELDEYVWRQACRYMSEWRSREGKLVPLSVSVNISRVDLYNPNLSRTLRALVEEHDLPPSSLKLEITESAYMDNPDQLIHTIRELQGCGFTVEMDDFGAGYSSLNILKNVPVDILKLDVRFLQSGGEDVRGGSILCSVMQMARWLDLPVIAEGVETREQAEFLRSLGCRFMQGYLFSRPIPADDFIRLVHEREVTPPVALAPANREDLRLFWDLSRQGAMLFGAFSGPAALAERRQAGFEILRANDRFWEEEGRLFDTLDEDMRSFLARFDSDMSAVLHATLDRAAAGGGECICELTADLPGGQRRTRQRVRLLDSNEDCQLFFLTAQRLDDGDC